MTIFEIVNLIQRLVGIIALGLLVLQIYLGSTDKALRFHKINGIFTYFFVLLHPVIYLFYRYLASSKIDFYFVFVDACVICGNLENHFINLGRFALYFITIAVVVAKFNGISSWLKTNWKRLHLLNYVAFYLVSLHSILIGTDSNKTPFVIYWLICQFIVLYSLGFALKSRKILH